VAFSYTTGDWDLEKRSAGKFEESANILAWSIASLIRRCAAAFLSFSAANFKRPAALSAASAYDLALLNCASSLLCLLLVFCAGDSIGVANKLGALILFDLPDTRWTRW
jgi:hypothetical protein